MEKSPTRRQFLRWAGASALAAGTLPTAFAEARTHRLPARSPGRPVAANDRIAIATIGMGGMGYGDTQTALRIEGVEFVAAADSYDGRLEHAREVFGADLFITRDYREILARPDIDAVIIATPDHWHARITNEALQAGKAVYVEKPMVHDLAEGHSVISTARETGKLLLVGSQRVSSLLYEKARDLYTSGAIGTLNLVEANINRNSSIGAWQYTIPLDASPETCDWEGFLGDAPSRPFDPVRFFRWRNYDDYGTGVPGDLFVHLYSGIHFVLGSIGPTQIMSTGGLRHWKDGRDAPDVMMGLYHYPETENHPEFSLALQVNFADGGGGGSVFRFVGNEGVITIDGDQVSLSRLAPESDPGYTVGTFTEAMQEQCIAAYREKYPEPARPSLRDSGEEVFRAPRGYDDRLDHFTNFFEAMRTDGSVLEDAVFGFRAAAPALLTNMSYASRQTLHWNPETMELVTQS